MASFHVCSPILKTNPGTDGYNTSDDKWPIIPLNLKPVLMLALAVIGFSPMVYSDLFTFIYFPWQ